MAKTAQVAKRNRGAELLLYLRLVLGLLQMIVSMAALVLLMDTGLSEATVWAIAISVCLIFIRSLLSHPKRQSE